MNSSFSSTPAQDLAWCSWGQLWTRACSEPSTG